MKKNIWIIVLLATTISCNHKKRISISLMTYNVRYGLADDGENSWQYRKEAMTALIVAKNPDFLGTQEGLPFQVNYIQSKLPNHLFIGKSREGNGKGEYSAIFYNKTKYSVVKRNTFWLSKTPNKFSKGWDAAYPRICTYGLFSDITSQKKFWVINTHLDHKGVKAREESVRLILSEIEKINTDNLPLFFMGDLNATANSNEIKMLKSKLVDTRELSKTKPQGPIATFNGFDTTKDATELIDYIFVNNRNNLSVKNHSILNDKVAAKYPSDHFPVYTEIAF